MQNLDQTDYRLLSLLRENARYSIAYLPQKLQVSRGTVTNRIAKLEDEGIIRGYTVELRPENELSNVHAWTSIVIEGNMTLSVVKALAFYHLLGIDELAIFDIDRQASEKLVRNLQDTGISIVIADSVADAVKGADIITTVTAEYSKAHILTQAMLEAGVHTNAVGGDSPNKTELDPRILDMGDVYVEFEPQTRVEGELQNKAVDFPVKHLADVFKTGKPARLSDEEITIFDSVGFAIEDFSAIRYIHDVALRLGLANPIDLVPDLEDPKDLFGYLK